MKSASPQKKPAGLKAAATKALRNETARRKNSNESASRIYRARNIDGAQAKRETSQFSRENRSCDMLGKAAVGGNCATLALPIGPRFCTKNSWDSKGCCSIPYASGGRGEAFDFPLRKGTTGLGDLICPGAGNESEASYIRMKCRF